MRVRGPLATLLAVVVAGAAVVTTNVVLTAGPSDVEQPTAALSAQTSGYGSDPAAAAPAPAAAPQASAPVRYDGRTAGDEVTVQVTVVDGQATAYICNPDKGIESWARGGVTDGRMRLTGDDGATVDATSDGKAVFGTAGAKGRTWPFAASLTTDAAPAAGAAPAATRQAPAPAEQSEAPAPQPQTTEPDAGGGY